MLMLVLMASHDKKGHPVLHFDHLEVEIAVVLLMMLYTSHDLYTKAVTSNDINISGIMPMASHDTKVKMHLTLIVLM